MLWFPYAKINLGLAILNQRIDGYHNIESLLSPIKLYDILEIIENPNQNKDELKLTGFPLDISIEDNLVWKSVLILRKHYTFPSIKIHLHKQIPSGAGLGGGSSDAAHTLLAINRLFHLNINRNALIKLALEIGSDCPFFLIQKTQYAKGRGELLKPFKLNLNPLKLLLIIPDISISTKNTYDKATIKTHYNLPKDVLKKPIENWKQLLKNDFENIIFTDFPLLAEIKEKLYQKGAIYVSLSGSGSGIYAFFSEKIVIKLPEHYRYYWLIF
ncbi:MAG: 4-(cytidine 5'-diphospho)-2-C-methyl-D-erythritol kinase [Bacteroidetes bacterium]|nr:MAG: 4-(cytidine 5'-diphospho)-2-C-methyl-D-erythritol kinase [Bacteroidota bacterium]